MQSVTVGTGPLTLDEVVAVARAGAAVRLDPESESAIAASRKVVETP